jgi:UDP-glucose 4-epimerase
VVVVDNLSNSNRDVEDRIKEITGKHFTTYIADICDDTELSAIFEKESIDAVIHFAAYKAVGESVQQPIKYYENNIGGMISLLSCMRKHSVKAMVFSSSCTVYGDSKASPITETHPIVDAISPYGTTKIIGEQLLQDITQHTKIKGVSLRYFNPVGAHPSALIGELPIGIPSNLVPFITQTAAGIREELTIFGNDYNTPDGTNIRDYIHVVDLAKAHVKSLKHLNSTESSIDYINLGTGHGFSVLEVVKAFEQSTGEKLAYKFGDKRPGDVEQIWADNRKAKAVLDWECEYTLEQMMSSAWEWQNTINRLGLNS